jgi:hypothetical protein
MGESWEFRVSRNVADEKSGVVEALLTEALGPSRPGPPLPSGRRGLDAWEVLVVANASVFLASFVQRTGERAADALFDLLTRFKQRVSGGGTVVVEDDAGTDRLELNVRTVTIDEIRAVLAQRVREDRSSPSGRNYT